MAKCLAVIHIPLPQVGLLKSEKESEEDKVSTVIYTGCIHKANGPRNIHHQGTSAMVVVSVGTVVNDSH